MRVRISDVSIAASALVMLGTSVALACPDCRIGRDVRRAVFGDGFWSTLGALALPLLVMAAVAALLYRMDAG